MNKGLFQQGYRTFPRCGCTLFVRKPDGEKYVYNPYTRQCSCPAGARGLTCKHSREIVDLVFGSMDALEAVYKFREAKRLSEFWFDYTDSRRVAA